MTHQDLKHIVRRWWQTMNLPPAELAKAHLTPAGSANRAILRRCATLDAVCMTEGFRDLWGALAKVDGTRGEIPIDVAAAIAAILCHVKRDEPGRSVATAAGRLDSAGRVRVSEMRFSRLLNARSLDELVIRLRRLMPLIESAVDVALLADNIADWARQLNSKRPMKPNQRIAMRWAMEYYGANEEDDAPKNGESA